MTDVAQIQPEHFVPVTNRRKKGEKWKSNVIQEFNSRPKASHSWHKFSFHSSEDTLHFTLALSTSTVMYGCAGACATLLTAFRPVIERHGISTSIEKGWRYTLVLLPLQGPLTFFVRFRSIACFLLGFPPLRHDPACSEDIERKKKKEKEIRVHGRVIKNEGNEGFPWQLFPLFSEYDSPPRRDCGVGLERERERESFRR